MVDGVLQEDYMDSSDRGKMKNKLTLQPGSPLPYGSTVTPDGINFALFSRHAEAVTLVVAGGDRPGVARVPARPGQPPHR